MKTRRHNLMRRRSRNSWPLTVTKDYDLGPDKLFSRNNLNFNNKQNKKNNGRTKEKE